MLPSPKNFPYIFAQLKQFRKTFFILSALLLSQILLTILLPVPLRIVLNQIFSHPRAATQLLAYEHWHLGTFSTDTAVLILAGATLAIGLALVLATWAEQILSAEICFRLYEKIRRDFLAQIFSRQQTYLDSCKKVDLLGRLSGDVENLEILVMNGIPTVARDLPMIAAVAVILFAISPRLCLFFFVSIPAFYFLANYFTSKMRESSQRLRRKTVAFEVETHEALRSLATIKSLRSEGKLLTKILGRVGEITTANQAHRRATSGMEISLGAAQYFVRAGLYLLGGWAVFRGRIGLGDLYQFITYMEVLARQTGNFSKFLTKLPKCSASMERIEELHQELSHYPESSGSLPIRASAIAGAPDLLRFQNTSFRHHGRESILDHFSARFTPGQLVALVGASGAGKTTFSRLLNRLIDPTDGQIVLGGQDLRTFDLFELRRFVRIVSQETFLLAGSVRENLLLASEGPIGLTEIEAALEKMNALGLVRSLPQGLDTLIGEGGRQLSGGEAKRLHLARALLGGGAEILLFDEPTSGLDPISAEKVVKTLAALSQAKSLVFWITHRLSELAVANRVLFFPLQGNPVFSTHSELLRIPAYQALAADLELESPSPPPGLGPLLAAPLLEEALESAPIPSPILL